MKEGKPYNYTVMNIPGKSIITIRATIEAPVEKVWKLWTDPKHIIHWNNASDDWYTPKAVNDLRVEGRFHTRMEARDGSSGFDFTGKYNKVEQYKQIEYTMDDGRNVQVSFISKGNITTVMEAFETEQTNSAEMQQAGWQAILDNFKEYVESTVKPGAMHFEIIINTSVEKVYQIMLDDKGYKEWTAVFNPSAHFIGSWEKGSKILFLGTDEDGGTGGMISRIRENIPGRFVSIEHMGIVQNSKEIFNGPEVEQWTGALETYTFIGKDGITLLKIDLDADQKYRSYFTETWPKALSKLKEICER